MRIIIIREDEADERYAEAAAQLAACVIATSTGIDVGAVIHVDNTQLRAVGVSPEGSAHS